MIEGIAAIGAVTASSPSIGGSVDRRQKRLKWLSSLRAAQGDDGRTADGLDESRPEIAQSRAQIADALSVVEEMRGLSTQGSGDDMAALSGPTVTAAELARRIAASAARSLAAQAHAAPASVRRYLGEGHENLG